MVEYESLSEEFIMDRIDGESYGFLIDPLINLSCILGDRNGRLSRKLAGFVTEGVDIEVTGRVLRIDNNKLSTYRNDHFPIDVYVPEVSFETYKTYRGLKRGSREVTLDPIDFLDIELYSPLLFQISEDLDLDVSKALKILYIELFQLYREMLNFNEDNRLNMSKLDLQRMVRNICAINNFVETKYDLCKVLRDTQRSLMYLSHIDRLYESTYEKDIRELRSDFNGL